MSGACVVGVIITVPEPFHTELAERRRRSGDPHADGIPPHITLLPPTEVPVESLEEIEAHLARVACAHAPFELHLSSAGTFRPVSQVVFVQVAAGLSQCELIESAVRTGPLLVPVNFPYHPHVTVAHDVPDDELDRVYADMSGYQARFTVDFFTMFGQDANGVWRTYRDFKLGESASTREG
jgi:2'-5' RNA ligase